MPQLESWRSFGHLQEPMSSGLKPPRTRRFRRLAAGYRRSLTPPHKRRHGKKRNVKFPIANRSGVCRIDASRRSDNPRDAGRTHRNAPAGASKAYWFRDQSAPPHGASVFLFIISGHCRRSTLHISPSCRTNRDCRASTSTEPRQNAERRYRSQLRTWAIALLMR
jgi:hypothetical protein